MGNSFSIDQNETVTYKSITNRYYEKINPELRTMRFKAKNSPVCVKDGSIKVKSNALELGKQYPVLFENKKYVVIMPSEGVIDLYELAD